MVPGFLLMNVSFRIGLSDDHLSAINDVHTLDWSGKTLTVQVIDASLLHFSDNDILNAHHRLKLLVHLLLQFSRLLSSGHDIDVVALCTCAAADLSQANVNLIIALVAADVLTPHRSVSMCCHR